MISVATSKSGIMQVYVQGNLDDKQGKTVIMTVHDVGTNRKTILISWLITNKSFR
jgi:hypothetical protein